MATEKPYSSCFVALTPELLEKATTALGLKRQGERLFKARQHAANVWAQRYIFFLMSGDHYARLIKEAQKNENLSAF